MLFSSVSFAVQSYEINCFGQDLSTEVGSAKVELNSTIKLSGKNDYEIEGGNFYFQILSEPDAAWTEQNVPVGKVSNKKDYRPSVYKDYAKFENLSPQFNGVVDLIISHTVFEMDAKNFTAVFMFRWVEDHWGGTLKVKCTLK